MSDRPIDLPSSWLDQLAGEFEKPYMGELRAFLLERKKARAVVYPPGEQIFAAFKHTPFDQVRVVILGQDPYHGPKQAHGLCFSVQEGVAAPPSLVNIFAEIERDLSHARPKGGCLTPWADQGVLLLNAVLTVEQGRAGAHQGKGWETFTDKVVEVLNEGREHLVFLLWGAYAQRKGSLVDRNRHLVLSSPHPSPLSAHRGFIGNGHFSATNGYLRDHGQPPIDWCLP